MVRNQTGLILLLGFSVLIAPRGASGQYADGRQRAVAMMDRSVRVEAERPGSIREQGYGFVVGEGVDPQGRPVLLVVTADHVVRDKDNPEHATAPIITLYGHQDQRLTATLLDLRLPPVQGDLAVLEVAKPTGSEPKPADMAPVGEIAPGTLAWKIGKSGVWLPSISPGQYVGRDGLWMRFDGLDTPRGSSGAPVLTDKGLVGMVVLDEGVGGESRVLPIDVIAAKFREWGLAWSLKAAGGAPGVPPSAGVPLLGAPTSLISPSPAPAAQPPTEPESQSRDVPTATAKRGDAFPVVASPKDLNSAIDLARKIRAVVKEYPVEVYLAENDYYAVTLGGYLLPEDALKRVKFARDRKIAADAYVWQSNQWGDNLFK
jgi:hypothetical protein